MTHRPITVTNDDGPLLTASQAAALLSVNKKTIYRWDKRGFITGARTPTGQLRYRRSEVEALLTRPGAA